MNKSLKDELLFKFSKGLEYGSAKELCIAIFCSADWLPNVNSEECTKQGIAESFSHLAKKGGIVNIDSLENSSIIKESSFWIQLINDSMKSGCFYDGERVRNIISQSEQTV